MSLSRTSETENLDAKHGLHEENINEVELLDRSGMLCGSLRDPSKSLGENSRYKYRQHSPAEYSGLECGGYFRWGSGAYTGPTFQRSELGGVLLLPNEYEHEVGEAGLNLGLTAFMFGQGWLRYGVQVRAGVGRFSYLEPVFTSEPVSPEAASPHHWFMRMPIIYTQKAYPWFLYGLGIEGFAGVDPVMLSVAGKWSNILEHLDYGARAAYVFTFENWAIGTYFGYERGNFTWDEYVRQNDIWKGSLSIDIDCDGI